MPRIVRSAGGVSRLSSPVLHQRPDKRESSKVHSCARRRLGHANPQLVLKRYEVGQPLVDLDEQVRTRPFHVLIPKLDDHLGEPTDGAHSVHRVCLPRRVGIATHVFRSLPLGNGAPRRISKSCFSSSTGTPSSPARSALLPASSPANTALVFFDTEPATLAPERRRAASASMRVMFTRRPV